MWFYYQFLIKSSCCWTITIVIVPRKQPSKIWVNNEVPNLSITNCVIFGSDNGLFPVRCQAIISTNDDFVTLRPLETNFNEISRKIQQFSFKIMNLNISSAKWEPIYLDRNVYKVVPLLTGHDGAWTWEATVLISTFVVGFLVYSWFRMPLCWSQDIIQNGLCYLTPPWVLMSPTWLFVRDLSSGNMSCPGQP